MKIRIAQLIALITTCVTIANAQPTIFFGENVSPWPVGGVNDVPKPTNLLETFQAASRFYAQLPGVFTETFEHYSHAAPQTILFATTSASLNGDTLLYSYSSPDSAVFGGFAFSGTNILGIAGGSGQFFTVTFSSPQAAFGFFGADVERNELRLTFVGTNGKRRDIPVPVSRPQGSGGAFFFGLIDRDSPFTAVEFHNIGPNQDGFDLDDLTIASPEQVRPMLAIRVSQVELSWETLTNSHYQVFYRDALTTSRWQPWGSVIRGDGSRFYTNDFIPFGHPQRYYCSAVK